MKQGTHPAGLPLRAVIIAGGIGSSILFVLVGVAFRLQLFGDGSIFSYAVAAQSAWSFHWHNVSGRLFTYLFAYPLAEAVAAISQNAQAGIAVYGFLFFAAPLLGLVLTFAVDRTSSRTIFIYACLSTVFLCPLVYGAPTDMWMAHAMFWPALALCLSSSPTNGRGTASVFAALLALVFTHEGGVVLSVGILFALLLRGWRNPKFGRAFGVFCATLLIWATVKALIRPDNYIAGVFAAAAFKFIDIRNVVQPAFLSLLVALTGYASLIVLLRWMNLPKPHVYAAGACATTLAIYWIWFDDSLLTEARYNLRTLLLIMIPALGVVASVHAMNNAERHDSPFPFLPRWATAIEAALNPQMAVGALLLIMLVQVVETSKFVLAWLDYKSAVRALATGIASDPQLGSPLFVSSRRIDAKLNRLAWNSTTPFLSVLVAPGLAPNRLVVDPDAGYFWLSCQTARQSEATSGALPASARQLVRIHACPHRQ
jgi:hypothetical protein